METFCGAAKQRRAGLIFDADRFELRQGFLRDLAGVLQETFWADAPVDLDLARKTRHGIGLNPHTRDALLLALDEGGSGPAKRI